MIVVHHLENSRSQRVLWLLEELDVPYEIVRYQRRPDLRAPPELKAVHPLGKSPVLVDDGRALAETGAIVIYVLERHGNGRLEPERGTDERWAYEQFLHYAEGSLMPQLLLKLVLSKIPERAGLLRPVIRPLMDKAAAVAVDPQLRTQLLYCEASLEPSGWFAGSADLTAADVMMSFPLEAAASRVRFDPYPRCRAFLQRIHARPAYARALERGGPYAYAKST